MAALCEGVHNYSKRPDIGLLPFILFATNHFRSHIVGSAADDSQFLMLVGYIEQWILRQLNPKSISFTLLL